MPTKPKKIPMRQCLGCREMKPKKELVRVVRTPQGEVVFDKSGRANGRGAYLCGNVECYKRAVKSRAISRAFGVAVPDEVLEALEGEMEGADE